MSFVQTMTGFGETVPLPDMVTRAAIKLLVGRTQRQLSRAESDADRRFAYYQYLVGSKPGNAAASEAKPTTSVDQQP